MVVYLDSSWSGNDTCFSIFIKIGVAITFVFLFGSSWSGNNNSFSIWVTIEMVITRVFLFGLKLEW